jgi:hypothetical protein
MIFIRGFLIHTLSRPDQPIYNESVFMLSVTRERIRQMAKALRKLKHPSRSRKPRSFLDN